MNINKSTGLPADEQKAEFVMRASRVLAISLVLICGTLSAAYAANPDDLRGSEIDSAVTAPDRSTQAEPQGENSVSPDSTTGPTNTGKTAPPADSSDNQQTGIEAPAPAENAADTAKPAPQPAAVATPTVTPLKPAEIAMPTPASPPSEAVNAPAPPASDAAPGPAIVASRRFALRLRPLATSRSTAGLSATSTRRIAKPCSSSTPAAWVRRSG